MENLILLSNHGGGLSNAFLEIIENNKYCETQNKKLLIATYSPTLRKESLKSYDEEIKYYIRLINSLKENEHLIYISSQTLELTNKTFYSKAKEKIEKILKENCKNYTILRPGMIFDLTKNRYTLSSMEKASRSYLTFFNDIPKTTICTVQDIYDCIQLISKDLDYYNGQIINIGITRYTFEGLQNISNFKRFRLPLVPFLILRFISLLSTRINAYTNGEAISSAPSFSFDSIIDKKK